MRSSQPTEMAHRLAAARAAYDGRRWADALQQFRECDALRPLAREDLVRLTWSAGMLDRDDDLLACFARLFEESEAAGDPASAAYWAFFHGFRLMALREHGLSSAWLQRARRQADSAGEGCSVHGYLLLPQIIKQVMSGECGAAISNAQRALEVAGRCSDAELEALARCWMGKAMLAQGQLDDGVAALDEAMLLALGDSLSPVVTGLVYCNLIASCRQVYDFERAREWTAALVKWCHSQPQLVQFGGACELHRAEILELDGSWQESVAAARDATRRAVRPAHLDIRAGAAYQEGEIHRLRGEWPLAEQCFIEAHRLGMDPQPGLALLRLATTEAAQASAMLHRSLSAAASPLARARLLPALVECLLETGAIEAAADAAAQLQAVADSYPSSMLDAAAAQARGRVRLAQGDPGGAMHGLERALSAWLRLSAPYLAAGARVLLGLACRGIGDMESSRMHFEAARECFIWLGAQPALRKLEALDASAACGTLDAGLSPRELEVLRLLATGQTNKGIARELGLSEKTVERHLSSIFDKLQVHTRSAATAFAFRHGLLPANP